MKPQNHHTLPEGWEIKRLEDVTSKPIVYGIVQAGPHVIDGMPYIKSSDLSNEKLELSILQRTSIEIAKKYKRSTTLPGDIVFSLRGNIGISQVLPEEIKEANLTQGTARISVKKDVENLFVKYALEAPRLQKKISEVAKGSTFKEISIEELRRLSIPLPPLPEQRQIAAVLGTWDRAIEQTSELLKALRTRHRGLMHQLLTGKKRLPGFEGEWRKVNADEVFRSVSIRNYPNEPLLSATQERGVIPRSMLEGRVTMPESDTSSYKLVVPGDFIISLRSFQGGIESSDYRGIVSPAYTVLKPTREIEKNFYRHYFKSLRFIQQLGVAVIGIRDGKQISFEDFSAIKVPNPTIEEQRAIARVLDASLTEIQQNEAKLDALREQKRGLMQCLLTGKIRVPGV